MYTQLAGGRNEMTSINKPQQTCFSICHLKETHILSATVKLHQRCALFVCRCIIHPQRGLWASGVSIMKTVSMWATGTISLSISQADGDRRCSKVKAFGPATYRAHLLHHPNLWLTLGMQVCCGLYQTNWLETYITVWIVCYDAANLYVV